MAGTFPTWVRTYARQAPATSVIVLVCTGAYVAAAIQARSLSDVASYSSLANSMLLTGTDAPHHPLPVLTSAFLHLNTAHLVLNMFMLILVGREIETALGTRLYSLVYLTGIIGSAAGVVWMTPTTPTAGASGALFALMAMLVAVNARRGGDTSGPLVLLAVNVAYSLLDPSVSLWGHLGGLLAGALMAFGAYRRPYLSTLLVLALSTALVVYRLASFA